MIKKSQSRRPEIPRASYVRIYLSLTAFVLITEMSDSIELHRYKYTVIEVLQQ